MGPALCFLISALSAAAACYGPQCGNEGGDAVDMLQAHLTQHKQPIEAEVDPEGQLLCAKLRNQTWPTGRVLCPGSIPTYGWDVYNQECARLTPRLLLQPSTVQDVQTAVKFAREHGLNISFRGQGHTYNCDAFKAKSLNLDLRTLGSNVIVDTESQIPTAKMEPGVTFAKMFEVLPSGYSFTHGTCETVGVMGYTLHGGWGATTSTWANESIVEIEMVTADGELQTLNAQSVGDKQKLFQASEGFQLSNKHNIYIYISLLDLLGITSQLQVFGGGSWMFLLKKPQAMHVAGSSFGIVTNLTIKLFSQSERPAWFLPVTNSFEYLLSIVPNETDFGWVGLARWDPVFYQKYEIQGSGWFLQITLKDTSVFTKAQAIWWILKNLIVLAIKYQIPVNFASSPETWNLGQYPFQTASVFTRFYSLTEIREAAQVLESFLRNHSGQCRYNLGPLQGEERWPLVTVECNTPETAQLLKDFVEENAAILGPDRPGSGYINLPLDGSAKYRQAYFPQYAELSATKCIWDPTDFFHITDGIQPSNC